MNLLTIVYGISNGWIAPNILRFQISDDSPVGPVSAGQAAFMVSSLSIGGVIGTILFGFLADILGRKWTIILLAIPQFLGNFLLLVGSQPYHIYLTRILFGLAGGGIFIVIPMFITEISHER